MAAGCTEHHVKFNLQEDEIKNHHENLDITQIGLNKFDINLGYLKVDHYYKVSFSLKLDQNYKKFVFLKEKSSQHVNFKELKRGPEQSDLSHVYDLTVVFYAFKEKHDKETIYFSLDDQNDLNEETDLNNILEIHLEAKVLGAHQGTPLLRNGITLLPNHTHHHMNSNSNEKLHFNLN